MYDHALSAHGLCAWMIIILYVPLVTCLDQFVQTNCGWSCVVKVWIVRNHCMKLSASAGKKELFHRTRESPRARGTTATTAEAFPYSALSS